jgi:hypothetical protein
MAEHLEEPAFTLIQTYDNFELRAYEPTIQARVKTADGRSSGAASSGFRRVASYIFGGNQSSSRIAMTAPVSMWEEDEQGWLAFTMPSAYGMEHLPQPNDTGVVLVACEEATVAVLSFSGRASPRKVARLETTLRAAVANEGLEAVGPVVLAVYENPWTTLPFRRRNELHVRVVLPQ